MHALHTVHTYLAVLVHLVVGELDLLEGDDLLPKLIARVRRIGVDVESMGRGRIRLPGHQP